jgi:hypothetical protein
MKKPAEVVSLFSIRPNPSQCLVYDIVDRTGRSVSRQQARSFQDLSRRDKAKKVAGDSDIRVCAEGDSWINILYPWSAPFGYHPTFFDIIEDSSGYYTASTGYPGDTFEEMRAEKDYRTNVASGSFKFFIFSGGGNDILGGGALRSLLKWREEVSGTDPKACIHETGLEMALDVLRSGYKEISSDIRRLSRRTRMLIHSYDYAIPRADGPWIGRPMIDKGYNLTKDRDLVRGIVKHLVDSYHVMLGSVPHTMLVDLRRTVGEGRWKDELHPMRAASRDIAGKFKSVMEATS